MADLGGQHVEARLICLTPAADHDIDRRKNRQHVNARELAKTALEAIPADAALTVLRHDEPNPWMW